MRRLVVISSKKSKLIMASVGAVLSLTSIHLAATARIATLRREQEKLEQTAVIARPSALSQEAFFNANPSGTPGTNPGVATKQPVANAAASSKASERISSTVPASATSLAHKRQIIISIADRQLAIIDNGQPVKIYPIAVGARGTPSPDGDFVIVNHAKDPVYRHGEMEVPPGKDNPLGSRWMGLNLKGYGIHGTNVQSSVGKAASHGCFRMRKRDVEELYSLVQVGDTVMVRRERDAMIAHV